MYVFITTKTAWATLWAIFSLTHPVTLNHGPRVRAGQVQSKSTDTATWAGQIFFFFFFFEQRFFLNCIFLFLKSGANPTNVSYNASAVGKTTSSIPRI
jgi:hypothetical protein